VEIPQASVLLRIIVDESDTWHGKSLHTAIVEEARNSGLAGATVFRGFEGYGVNGRIHTTHLVDITPDLPMLVEIVDAEEKIQAFLPTVESMMQGGVVTLQPVTVMLYRAARGR